MEALRAARPKVLDRGDQFEQFLHHQAAGALVLLAATAAAVAIADHPAGVGWRHIAGAGALAGIGFTMSLFVCDLAFAAEDFAARAEGAIFAASIASGLLGYAILRWWAPAGETRG